MKYLQKTKIAIGALYGPPKIPFLAFEKIFDSLIYVYSRYQHTILLGDFNVNMLQDNSPEVRALNNHIIEPFDLVQLIKSPTRITETSSTLIDLILVSREENVLFSGACDAPGISDHHFTYLAYNIKKEKEKPKIVKTRCFKNFNFEGFGQYVEKLNWESIIGVGNINTKVTILENMINEALDKYAPFKTFTIRKSGNTPWIDEKIKGSMDERDKAKDSFNATGNETCHDIYRVLKNGVTKMMRDA